METPSEQDHKDFMPVKACLFGERIDLKNIKDLPKPIANSPLIFQIGEKSYVVVLRYGLVVFFGASDKEIEDFKTTIKPYVTSSYENDYEEENVIIVSEENGDSITSSGQICFKEVTIHRLQLSAEVLAKSVILNRYEHKISQVFENVEPLAENLSKKGRSLVSMSNLNRNIGEIILSMTQTIGRAELSEKPDVLWEHPELERLYARIAEEYEIKERSQHLNRKLDIASNAIGSFVDLKQHNEMSRQVWYVIILILLAIIIDIFL